MQAENQLKSTMTVSTDKYQELVKLHEISVAKANSEIQRLTLELDNIQQDTKFQIEEIEDSKRMLEDEVISLKSCISKDAAIYHQKQEFKDL